MEKRPLLHNAAECFCWVNSHSTLLDPHHLLTLSLEGDILQPLIEKVSKAFAQLQTFALGTAGGLLKSMLLALKRSLEVKPPV